MSDVSVSEYQVLTFNLEKEVYAVDIMGVNEVIDYTSVTKVPQTPDFMRGVINLRGNVVPVIDLKMKFGMKPTEKTVDTCIIIVEVQIDDEEVILGALADSVQEVVQFKSDSVEDAPRIGTQLNTDFIKCMAKREDDSFVIVLDTDRIFSSEELSAISAPKKEEN